MYSIWKGFSVAELRTIRDALALLVDANIYLQSGNFSASELHLSLSKYLVWRVEQEQMNKYNW